MKRITERGRERERKKNIQKEGSREERKQLFNM